MAKSPKQNISKLYRDNRQVVLVLIVAAILTVLLLVVRAAGTFVAYEAEGATVSGDIVTKSAQNASGGQFIEFTNSPVPPPTGSYNCSRMLSMSQGRQVVEGLQATGRVPNGTWEAEITGGARLVKWVDRNFEGYNGNMVKTCTGSPDPDRIVFLFDPIDSNWPSDLHVTIANIRYYHPQVKRIELILLVGAENAAICNSNTEPNKTVRATTTHKDYEGKLEAVAADYNDVAVGPDLEIPCSQFADSVGHLTDAGKLNVGNQMANWYGY